MEQRSWNLWDQSWHVKPSWTVKCLAEKNKLHISTNSEGVAMLSKSRPEPEWNAVGKPRERTGETSVCNPPPPLPPQIKAISYKTKVLHNDKTDLKLYRKQLHQVIDTKDDLQTLGMHQSTFIHFQSNL